MSRAKLEGAAECGPQTCILNLRYPGTALTVQLENAPDVERALSMTLNNWLPERTQSPETERVSHVTRNAYGYTAQSSYLGETIAELGVAGATCAILADLAQDYFETRPAWLALHCAAFRYNGRLIALTGPARTGKSTLAARLTQEPDCEVFCDDVLPVAPDGRAVGLGIPPRLRLPLPDQASPDFMAHVERHMGARDDRYGYLWAPTVAPHGTADALSVLLLLERRQAGPARFHEVAEDTALKHLLSRNMADLHTAETAFARLSDLLAGVTCLQLVYSDLEDAITAIRETFGSDDTVAPSSTVGPALTDAQADALPEALLSPDILWARCPEIVVQHRDNAAFLWRPGDRMIWHMNTLGLAVWTLLEIPGSAQDVAEALQDVFADQAPQDLVRDVNALLQALADKGLILRCHA